MPTTRSSNTTQRITFIDGNTGAVVATEEASTLPESMRAVQTAAGLVPIVQVVAHTFGDQREIKEYGAGGELLRSTLQLAGAPG